MGLQKVDPDAFEAEPFLGLGRFAPWQKERKAHETRIRIFWHRVFGWLLALALLGWLALTGAGYYFVKHKREFSAVKYTHILFYPWMKHEYRRAKCEFLIERGKAEFAEGKYLESFYNMRLGLYEVPEDTDARRKIMQLYYAVRRFDLAEMTLLDGLAYNAENWDYVMETFRFLFARQRDDKAVEVSRELLGKEIKNRDVRHSLAMAQASAHFFRGRYTAAEAVLREHDKMNTRDGALLRAQIFWESGRRDRAVDLLAELAQQYASDNEIYRVRVIMLREMGRLADIRSLCVLRQIEQPEHPRAYVDALLALDPKADAVRWAGEVAEVFSRFPNNEEAMNGLAEVAAGAGQVELAWRVYKQCRALGLSWSVAATSVLEANLVAKRYADALLAAQAILDENVDWARTKGVELNALRAVANYAQGDTALATLQLQSYLAEVPAAAHNLTAVAERFLQVGAVSLARTVLAKAVEADEFNQAALTRWIGLDLESVATEDLLVNTERLLELRRPPQAILEEMQGRLQSDRYLMLEGRERLIDKIGSRLAVMAAGR